MLWRGRDAGVLPALLDAADVLLLGADEAEAAFGTGDPAALRARFPPPPRSWSRTPSTGRPR
ncbi:hypothetical protein GCM10025734_67100 [Kitasatospora paranensis]|uniref:hypothetical protein n=1 Tax=Kitasatospora paranensis TaxID=258053 RepID=UPI0031ED1857